MPPVECWTARVYCTVCDSCCRRLCSIVRVSDGRVGRRISTIIQLLSPSFSISCLPPILHSRSNSQQVIRVLLFYAVSLMWSLFLRYKNVYPLYPSVIGCFPSLSVSYRTNVDRFSFLDAKTSILGPQLWVNFRGHYCAKHFAKFGPIVPTLHLVLALETASNKTQSNFVSWWISNTLMTSYVQFLRAQTTVLVGIKKVSRFLKLMGKNRHLNHNNHTVYDIFHFRVSHL